MPCNRWADRGVFNLALMHLMEGTKSSLVSVGYCAADHGVATSAYGGNGRGG